MFIQSTMRMAKQNAASVFLFSSVISELTVQNKLQQFDIFTKAVLFVSGSGLAIIPFLHRAVTDLSLD